MKQPLFALMLTAFSLPLRGEEEAAKAPTEVAVQVAKVIKTTLTRSVTAFGSIEPAPGTQDQPPARVKLSPAAAGIIAEIHGVEGQRVNKGDVLFRLDSRAVDAAVDKAALSIRFATANVERQKKLIVAEGTSEKQVLEAEQALATANAELATAKVQQSLLRGEAPISGTLVMFEARPGEAANESTALAEIVDLDRLVTVVRVSGTEAVDLNPGQKASLQVNGREGVLAGTVDYVSPQVDAATDTVLVRLAVPKDGGLRLGGFVTVRIVVEEHAGKLAVPVASVYTDAEGKSTLSIVEGDTAKRKEVTTGLRDGDLVEVTGEGIAEGVTVVTSGSYALPEETRIHVLNTEPLAK